MSRPTELLQEVRDNFWIKLATSVFAAVATYLTFRQVGLLSLFWLLLALLVFVIAFVGYTVNGHYQRQRQNDLFRKAAAALERDSRFAVLESLVEDLGGVEKALVLGEKIGLNSPAKVICILSLAGRLGVVLNLGREEGVEVGTPLAVYRTDRTTPDGDEVEELLAIVRVTYVQAGNNLSQAIIENCTDSSFAQATSRQLKDKAMLGPPKNFAIPYVPRELAGISLQGLQVLRGHLQAIRASVLETQPSEVAARGEQR